MYCMEYLPTKLGRFWGFYVGKYSSTMEHMGMILEWVKTYQMDTLILTSLLVSMGISTFTSKEFVICCGVPKIGNDNIILEWVKTYQYYMTGGIKIYEPKYVRGTVWVPVLTRPLGICHGICHHGD